ncbi:MAG: hypothetical protein O2999_00860, partial [Nitrospirae bacterium]|nr:hypothetical protein [Nitrospirota bacterium]
NHVSTKDLQQDHEELDGKLNMLKDQTDMVKDQLTTLQTTVDNLPTGGGVGAEGNHTLRWDQNLPAAERFVRVLPTAGDSRG